MSRVGYPDGSLSATKELCLSPIGILTEGANEYLQLTMKTCFQTSLKIQEQDVEDINIPSGVYFGFLQFTRHRNLQVST